VTEADEIRFWLWLLSHYKSSVYISETAVPVVTTDSNSASTVWDFSRDTEAEMKLFLKVNMMSGRLTYNAQFYEKTLICKEKHKQQ